MKKSRLLLIGLLIYSGNSFSQGGIWTWVSGSNTVNSPPVFGTQGIPSVNNRPAALYEYAEWKDKQGNLWLYGGYNPFTIGSRSDLWKYDPISNEWTWVKGNGLSNQSPVYGTQGVPDPLNTPGQRTWAAVTWVDTSGGFWLFGGHDVSSSLNAHNDLWHYNISTNEWTWIKGSNLLGVAGVHGVPGVPGPLNNPGSRGETCSAWTDSSNFLWLFGGQGLDDAGINGDLNDLMRYDISTNEWTWMSGSALVNQASIYGTKGVPSPGNRPGARNSYTKWKDLQGNFWLMGGGGVGGFLSDVWKYDLSISQWTWMAGPNFGFDNGQYIAYCVADTIHTPCARIEHRASVTDDCGRFWMMGGSSSPFGRINDLWLFDPVLLKWKWMSGTTIGSYPGNYGTLGVPDPANMPPARDGAIAWWTNDRLYITGGIVNTDGLNDLWTFTPDSSCVAGCPTNPIALFTAPHHICPGTCTDFTNLSVNATFYQWLFPGGSPASSTDFNPSGICYNTPGNYDVTLIAGNATGSDTVTLPNYIVVYPYSPSQSILQSGDTLFSNAGFASYQWYFNGDTIPGATNYFYIATQSGNYSVVCLDGNGCSVEAVVLNVIATVTDAVNQSQYIHVFPNPADDVLVIRLLSDFEIAEIIIYDLIGAEIFSGSINRDRELRIDISDFPAGIYFLKVNGEKFSAADKVIIE